MWLALLFSFWFHFLQQHRVTLWRKKGILGWVGVVVAVKELLLLQRSMLFRSRSRYLSLFSTVLFPLFLLVAFAQKLPMLVCCYRLRSWKLRHHLCTNASCWFNFHPSHSSTNYLFLQRWSLWLFRVDNAQSSSLLLLQDSGHGKGERWYPNSLCKFFSGFLPPSMATSLFDNCFAYPQNISLELSNGVIRVNNVLLISGIILCSPCASVRLLAQWSTCWPCFHWHFSVKTIFGVSKPFLTRLKCFIYS